MTFLKSAIFQIYTLILLLNYYHYWIDRDSKLM